MVTHRMEKVIDDYQRGFHMSTIFFNLTLGSILNVANDIEEVIEMRITQRSRTPVQKIIDFPCH